MLNKCSKDPSHEIEPEPLTCNQYKEMSLPGIGMGMLCLLDPYLSQLRTLIEIKEKKALILEC